MTERWDQVMATLAAAVPEGATIIIDSRRPSVTESVAGRGCSSGCAPLRTGRALNALREAVGPEGTVIGIDHTGQMLEVARAKGRAGGRLVLFHPSGRAALAARQGGTVRPTDPLNGSVLAGHLSANGWSLTDYDDAEDRFFALAIRDTVPSHRRTGHPLHAGAICPKGSKPGDRTAGH